MASYIKKLQRDLEAAAAEGIISAEQAAKVLEKARSAGLFSGFSAAHWIGAAAGFFIAMGTVLVISHNWAAIPPAVKVSGFLLLFLLTGEACQRLEGRPSFSVPLEILWFFMPIIGIGLYAQVFNLSGDPVRPYLAWAVLAAPLAVFSPRGTVSYLVSLLLFIALFYGSLGRGNMLALTALRGQAVPAWHWAAALLTLAGAVTAFFLRDRGRPRTLPLGAGLAWLLFLLFSKTALHVEEPALLMAAGVAAPALWLLWDGGRGERSPLPLLAWTAAVYIMTFLWHYKPALVEQYSEAAKAAGSLAGGGAAWALAGAALGSLLLRPLPLPEGAGEKGQFFGKGLLAVSVAASFLLFSNDPLAPKTAAVIANLVLAALGTGLILAGAGGGGEKAVNRGVGVLTLLAVTRFIDLFGSLLTSGVAFIFTGLAFAGLAYAVNEGRKSLIARVNK